MAWSFAYVALRRVLEFVVLLTRGDQAKEIEMSWCSDTRSPCFAATSPVWDAEG
jgi:hypothetical protein